MESLDNFKRSFRVSFNHSTSRYTLKFISCKCLVQMLMLYIVSIDRLAYVKLCMNFLQLKIAYSCIPFRCYFII